MTDDNNLIILNLDGAKKAEAAGIVLKMLWRNGKGEIAVKKIAVFFGEGYEEIEALTVVDMCRRAEIEVETVSITKEALVTGSHGISVKMDKLYEEVDFESLDMLVLPGGMPGTRNLEAHAGLMSHVDDFHKAGRFLAAICAAPSIFGHRGILKDKKVCCYPGFEKDLTQALVVYDSVAVDGHVITARGMGCAIDFSLAIITALCDSQVAKEKAESVIYHK